MNGGIGLAQVRRPAAIELRIANEHRHFAVVLRLQAFGDDGAEFGVFAIREVGRDGRMPAQEAMRAAGVFAAFVVQAAQERELVGHRRQARQQLADIDAGDVRANRLETARESRRGRPGLRSNVSRWLGPPLAQNRITEKSRSAPRLLGSEQSARGAASARHTGRRGSGRRPSTRSGGPSVPSRMSTILPWKTDLRNRGPLNHFMRHYKHPRNGLQAANPWRAEPRKRPGGAQRNRPLNPAAYATRLAGCFLTVYHEPILPSFAPRSDHAARRRTVNPAHARSLADLRPGLCRQLAALFASLRLGHRQTQIRPGKPGLRPHRPWLARLGFSGNLRPGADPRRHGRRSLRPARRAQRAGTRLVGGGGSASSGPAVSGGLSARAAFGLRRPASTPCSAR